MVAPETLLTQVAEEKRKKTLKEGAKKTRKEPSISNFVKGIVFERKVVEILSNELGVQVGHRGKAGDEGVDFEGCWNVVHKNDPAETLSPTSTTETANKNDDKKEEEEEGGGGISKEDEEMLKKRNENLVYVAGQCKFEKKRSSSRYVRDLESVIHHRSNTTQRKYVGFLVSTSGFSSDARKRHWKSRCPIILIKCTPTGLDSLVTVEVSLQRDGELAADQTALGDAEQKNVITQSVLDKAMSLQIDQFIMNLPAQRLIPNISVGTVRSTDGSKTFSILINNQEISTSL